MNAPVLKLLNTNNRVYSWDLHRDDIYIRKAFCRRVSIYALKTQVKLCSKLITFIYVNLIFIIMQFE